MKSITKHLNDRTPTTCTKQDFFNIATLLPHRRSWDKFHAAFDAYEHLYNHNEVWAILQDYVKLEDLLKNGWNLGRPIYPREQFDFRNTYYSQTSEAARRYDHVVQYARFAKCPRLEGDNYSNYNHEVYAHQVNDVALELLEYRVAADNDQCYKQANQRTKDSLKLHAMDDQFDALVAI